MMGVLIVLAKRIPNESWLSWILNQLLSTVDQVALDG